MGWITMSCGEQPSEAFTPALPRLQRKGRGRFTAPDSETFTPHTPSLSCWSLSDDLEIIQSSGRDSCFQVFPFKPSPKSSGGRTLRTPSGSSLSSTLQKRKMDAPSEGSSVVLKVLPWLFHRISSFCAFANEFNDPQKCRKIRATPLLQGIITKTATRSGGFFARSFGTLTSIWTWYKLLGNKDAAKLKTVSLVWWQGSPWQI